MSFGAIFFETRTARIAYAPTLPPFGLQSGGRRFRKKEPERRGKAVVSISLPNIFSPYEKRHIRSNAPFFITLLIGSFIAIPSHLFGKEIDLPLTEGDKGIIILLPIRQKSYTEAYYIWLTE